MAYLGAENEDVGVLVSILRFSPSLAKLTSSYRPPKIPPRVVIEFKLPSNL